MVIRSAENGSTSSAAFVLARRYSMAVYTAASTAVVSRPQRRAFCNISIVLKSEFAAAICKSVLSPTIVAVVSIFSCRNKSRIS